MYLFVQLLEEEEKKKQEREAKIFASLGSQAAPVCEIEVHIMSFRERKGELVAELGEEGSGKED